MTTESLSSKTEIAITINNRYVISDLEKDKLGEGGIGVVYKVLDTKATDGAEKYAVVKLLHQGLISDKWIVSKFDKEAKAIVDKISHPGIVKGKESGVLLDGRPYLIMEYIEGEALRKLIGKNPHGINLERAANILKQFGDALAAIHKANIYHKDLKPENIMLYFKDSDEYIKIIDFGIATVKESSNEKTQTTEITGTPAYMAPEQMMKGKVSAKSDIYAMGIVAYEILTGRRPFNVDTTLGNAYINLYQMQKAGVKVSPQQLRPNLSDKIDSLILQALEFEPSKRPTSAEELGNELYKALLEISLGLEGSENPEYLEVTLKKPDLDLSQIESKVEISSNLTETLNKPIETSKVKVDVSLKETPNEPNNLTKKNHSLTAIGLAILLSGIVVGKLFFNNASNSSENQLNPGVNGNLVTTTKSLNLNTKTRLTYSLLLSEFRNGKHQETMPITGTTIILHDRDQILFNILGEETGYVYLLNESPKPLENGAPKYNILFPAEKEINLIPAKKEFKLPKEDQAMEITGSKGIEKYWIVWSKTPIADLESLRSLLNKKDGGVVQDSNKANIIKELLEKYSNNNLITINEDKKARQMQATSSANIIVVSMEIDHR